MKILFKIKLFTLLAMLLICEACSREDIINTLSTNESEFDIQLAIRLPLNSLDTRGLTSEDENAVEELQVLAFDSDNDAFKYISYAKKVQDSPGTNEKKYVAKLRTGNYNLMVLANSNEYITASFPDKIAKDTPRSSITKLLQMKLTDKWVTKSGSDYKPIPMWGVKENVVINSQTDLSGENSFDVTRVLAKINITVDLEKDHKGTFELVSVRFHNRREKGQLIPNEWDNEGTHVQKPSLVEGDTGIEEALIYDGDYITENSSCVNEIYVLEAPEGNRNNHPKYPCLVIGGKYNNQLGYYRIDFANKANSTTNYIPLLRNHTYNIIITKVDGDGFTDPDDAYNSLPVNMDANIIDWNPNTIGDIYFDGQNYLSIEKGRYELSWKALTELTSENLVKIKTDHNDGWEIESIKYEGVESGWLTFEGGNSGLKDEESERWLLITTANSTKQERIATITIAVGRIRGKIIVKQEPSPDTGLIIRDKNGNIINNNDVIIYRSDNWTNQICDYSLEWTPANATVSVTLVNPVLGYKPMEFIDSSNMLQSGNITSPNGEHSFGFNIKPFDTSEIKQKGEIDLSLKSAIQYAFTIEGQETKFTVINELLDVQATKLGPCKQGRIYGIDVAYNTPWELILDGEHKIMDSRSLNDLPSEGGIEGQTGSRTIHVRLEVDKDFDGEEMALSFVKPNTGASNTFDKVDMESQYNHPNSYMVKTSTSFEFSVLKAYRMWQSELIDQPFPNEEMSMQVIWIDRIDQDIFSNIYLEKNIEFPEKSLIKGTTTKDGGNALVALLMGDNIVWSWHIWVTDYSPQEKPTYYYNSGIITTLMDRNLGAWYGGLGDIRNYGAYYQWGRKDPFPGPSRLNGTNSVGDPGEIGEGGNVSLKNPAQFYVKAVNAPAANNLIESIYYPYLFYKSPSYPNDWYTNNVGSQNNNLWHDYDQLKSDFDPCPDGWRVGSCFWLEKRYYYTWAFDPFGKNENYGWNYDGYLNIGNYPTAGYINYENGCYTLSQEECWLWYGNHSNEDLTQAEEKYLRLIDRTQNLPDKDFRSRVGSHRANGVPVRCERDEKRYWPK